MKPFLFAGLVLVATAPWASAQYVYGPPVFAPRAVVAPAPITTYSYYPAPVTTFSAPVTTYSAPVTTFSAPVTTYYSAPVTSYYSAPVTTFSAPVVAGPVVAPYAYGTTTYGGLFRPRVVNRYYYGW